MYIHQSPSLHKGLIVAQGQWHCVGVEPGQKAGRTGPKYVGKVRSAANR